MVLNLCELICNENSNFIINYLQHLLITNYSKFDNKDGTAKNKLDDNP